MKRLIIVRHGNTFAPGQTPTRVGAHTDLTLVEEGRGLSVGKYLASLGLEPSKVYAAPLKRTTQTAQLLLRALGSSLPVLPHCDFIEIDYGPDENQTEEKVEARLGRDSWLAQGQLERAEEEEACREEGKRLLDIWNTQAVPPLGWKVDVEALKQAWRDLAESIKDEETVVIVSSNGVIRFAPTLLSDEEAFGQSHDIKVVTGSVGIFEQESLSSAWECRVWGEKPYKQFS